MSTSEFLRVLNCKDCDKVVLKLTAGSLVHKNVSVRCVSCEGFLSQQTSWNNAVEDKFRENFYPKNSTHYSL